MREFSHCLREDIQHTLSKYMASNPLSFTMAIEDIYIGDLVMHKGKGIRNGWIGIVATIGGEDKHSRLDVIWMIDEKGKGIRGQSGNFDPIKSFGRDQSYSLKWFTVNCRKCNTYSNYKYLYQAFYHKHFERSLFEFDPQDKENAVQRTPEPLPYDRFIIWSPQGTRNPKGEHSCKKVATKVAVDMAIKHDQDFYVCQLVTVAKPLKKAKITQLYKDK